MPHFSSENEVVLERSRYSVDRLEQLRKRFLGISELTSHPGIAIYVTGSYGRLEASPRSDLDLFLIHCDSEHERPIIASTKTRIKAELIKIPRELGFPAFSDDGEYLQVHSLKDMLLNLGGREDDSMNHFTARLLLLLESRPLLHDDSYDATMTEVIEAYFRDYHDHEKDFRPIFLVNDILRFWKTLCLNYEHKRNIPIGDQSKKNKVYLKNLKLKFSRLLTCFSTVIPLIAAPNISPQEIGALIRLPPLKRLEHFAEADTDRQRLYERVLNEYVWFMGQVSRSDAENWIEDKAYREDAFERAKHFGSNVYQLLQLGIKNTDNLRYLVI